jgi:hypothetical protein
MASFPEHLIHQGAIFGALARLLGADPYLCTAVTIVTGLPNTYPDWGGVIKAYRDPTHPKVTHELLFGRIPYLYRWDYHDDLHRQSRWYCFLHQWVDLFFHDGKGPWFPRLWFYTLLSVFACFLLLVFVYF